MNKLEQLNERFGKPRMVFESGAGGLIKLSVRSPWVEGEVYLNGAHVTHFQPAGEQPVLWMSRHSHFEAGKPIRGGVPICFPWFGPHPTKSDAPAHGLARTKEWEVVSTVADSDGSFTIELAQQFDDFHCRYLARFAKHLELTLMVNLDANSAGAPSQPIDPQHVAQFQAAPYQLAQYQVALHSYFAVGDVAMINIAGLESASYIDKLDGAQRKPPTGLAIRFDGECDRVYIDTEATCVLHDPLMGRRIVVAKEHSSDTVIWNPWIAKAARMPDFGDDEWPQMVCIETAHASSFRTIRPGENQSITTRIAVES